MLNFPEKQLGSFPKRSDPFALLILQCESSRGSTPSLASGVVIFQMSAAAGVYDDIYFCFNLLMTNAVEPAFHVHMGHSRAFTCDLLRTACLF